VGNDLQQELPKDKESNAAFGKAIKKQRVLNLLG
jgi:hypothetical protein